MKSLWTERRRSSCLILVLIGLAVVDLQAQVFVPTGRMTRGRVTHSATLLQDGRVLIAGGEPTGSAEIYDPDSGTFAETGAMSSVRASHTAVLLRDGRVLIVGGCRLVCPINAELYDPNTGKFTTTREMSVPQNVNTAVLLRNGKVLVFGDLTVELFDPASETFVPIAKGRLVYSATLLSDGTVLVIGGPTSIFDPANNQFRNLRSNFDLVRSPAVTLLNGSVLFAGSLGGTIPPYFFSDDGGRPSALYDPTTQTFLPAADMTLPHEAGTATLLKDGRVLIAGGYHRDNVPAWVGISGDAEMYDPATGKSSSLSANMVRQRDVHSATLLRDGRVLITGGRTADSWPGVTDTLAELFIPESTQGAVPRLSFDRTRYCVGDSWFLHAEAVRPFVAIQISGTWDETPWTVPDWAGSGQDGTLVTTGTFGAQTTGNYGIWIHDGGKVSNTVSIKIEDCSKMQR